MRIHYAHLVLLGEQGIVASAQVRAIRDGLDSISVSDIRKTEYDGTCETCFSSSDRLLVRSCGEDSAGRCIRPLPERHRHDDVPHAAARVDSVVV
jgi:argininosuccinate lyase